jgi:long-chain acyl-CoA synthetase
VKKGWEGKHIAIIGSSSYYWMTAFLGIACSANVVVPIDKMLPDNEILNLLKMGDVEAVVLSEEYAHLIPQIRSADNQVEEIVDHRVEWAKVTRLELPTEEAEEEE